MNEDYTIEQAFDDIIYLAHRLKALEDEISEWTEFINLTFFKHMIDKKEHIKSTFLNSRIRELEGNVSGFGKALYEKFEEIYQHLNRKKDTHYNSYIYKSIKEEDDTQEDVANE